MTRLPRPDDTASADRYNRAARVISGWVRDPRYRDRDGNPAPVPLEGDGTDFAGLVKEYSGDVPVRAILDELVRVGSVEKGEDGKVRLVARAYIPATGGEEKIGILGADVSELVGTIDHNLQAPREEAFFQRKTMYGAVSIRSR